ncbi:MAG: DUF4836 family protein [Ferruginibacter sp.]
MQSRFRLPMLFFAAALVIFSSCSKKTNKEGRYIPKTAGVVILMNGESMTSKLPWEEIKENAMFKDAYSEYGLDENIKTVLSNPENTGIDTKKNLVMYIQKDSIGGYLAVEGTVKDAEKFKTFYTTLLKSTTATEKDGVHFLSNAKMTSSWDKEKFVLIIDVPGMNESSKYKNPYDTDAAASPVSKRDAVAAASQIYSLSEDNSLAKDEKFSALVATKGDFHFWINIGALAADNSSMAAMSMLNVSKLYENTYVTGVTNFDNGKINVDMKTYAGKELTDIYKKYSDTKLNTDMIKRIPSKDVVMLFALSFKPEGLKEFIKLTGTDGMINAGASQLGFTFDDFIKANKGDILLAITDIKKRDSSGVSEPSGFFTASVGDKAAFGKLIEAGNKIGKAKMGESMKDKFAYNVSDDYFVIGTDKLNVDKYLSTANNSNFSFLDKIAGSTSAFYFNIPGLMGSMSDQMTKDSLDNLSYQATVKMWENVIATGGGFKDGASNMHIEFNLVDKNTNSLKQLNNYVSTMGSIEKQRKANRSKMMDDELSKDMEAPKADTTVPAQ